VIRSMRCCHIVDWCDTATWLLQLLLLLLLLLLVLCLDIAIFAVLPLLRNLRHRLRCHGARRRRTSLLTRLLFPSASLLLLLL